MALCRTFDLQFCLSQITAFRFEGKLGLLKKYIKTAKRPLVQVCSEMEEEIEVEQNFVEISEVKILQSKRFKGIIRIKRLIFHDAELATIIQLT